MNYYSAIRTAAREHAAAAATCAHCAATIYELPAGWVDQYGYYDCPHALRHTPKGERTNAPDITVNA